MSLGFDPVYSWPMVFLAICGLLAVVSIGYPRRIRHLTPFWRRLLLALRLTLVAILAFWLLRPMVIIESDDRADAVLYILTDSSASMQTEDGPGGISRRQALTELISEASSSLEGLSDQVEIRVREMARDLTPAQLNELSETADGSMTAIGQNLERLAKEANQEKIAAVVILSDGKQAATGQLDVDPIRPARLLGKQHAPIYAVPFGSSEVASTSIDVAVSELDVPQDVFLRNVVPVRIRLKALGALGREVRLRVLVEDRSGLTAGQSGPMKVVRPDRNNVTMKLHKVESKADDLTLDLQFVPMVSGEMKVAVEAELLPGEVRRTNNRAETVIRVRSGGIRVAYFDRLRPEFKWLKRINVSNRIQLDAKWLKGGAFANRNKFDDEWFEPGNYDAFIIGDVPAEMFGEERLQKLANCVDQGAGLMMIGGVNSFGAGGYQNSALEPLLPVEMSTRDPQLQDKVKMVPTREGLSNQILQIASPDQNRARWEQLPELQGANVLKVKRGSLASVLAETPTKIPLMITHQVGRARVMAFAGDTTWLWALHSDTAAEAHQRFWRQVVFWLTKMEYDGESPLWLAAEPRNLSPGQLSEISFGLRDEQGLPIAGATYQGVVLKPDQTETKLIAKAVDSRGVADFQDTLDPGDYWVTVSTDAGEGRGILYASTRILVASQDPELDNPAADPGLLRELAHVSGGDFLPPREFLERLEFWDEEGLPSLQVKRSQRTNLWDNWYSLLAFIVVATAEWACRKKRGLV